MKKPLIILILACCGVEQEPVTTSNHEFCDHRVKETCILKAGHTNIDPGMISFVFNILEYESNYFYPGLNFEQTSGQSNYVVEFRWAQFNTSCGPTCKGEYFPTDAYTTIYLRRGENITPIMECMDRYSILAHETLHFTADRFLMESLIDPHQIEYYFKSWAISNDFPFDYSVEGRLYTLIRRKCNE